MSTEIEQAVMNGHGPRENGHGGREDGEEEEGGPDPIIPEGREYEYEGVMYDPVFPVASLEKARNMDLTPEDVLIAGYPKTGTTWLQEVLWLVANDADTEGATKQPIVDRIYMLELQFPESEPYMDLVNRTPPPRLMTTHLSWPHLKDAITKGNPKVLIMMRNPKDTLVSYFHFYNARPGINIPTFSDFFQLFREGKLVFGDWFDYTLDWWNANKDKDNFLFFKYEEMRVDHFQAVEEMSKFIGKDLSKEQIQKIVDFTSFNAMKSRKGVKQGNHVNAPVKEAKEAFTRKGKVGDWRNYFTEEQSAYVDKIVAERLAGTGLEFTS